MSQRRRFPEDSTVVSLGEVREMIEAEVEPMYGKTVVARVAPPRAVPMPVPEEVVGGVPSLAEVARQREARWRDESGVAAAPARPWRQRRAGRLAVVGVVAIVMGAAGVALGWWMRPSPRLAPGWAVAAATTAAGSAAAQRTMAADAARVEAAERAAVVAGERDALAARVAQLEAAAKAAAEADEAKADEAKADEAKAERAPKARRDRKRARRRPARTRRLSRTDLKVDALLDSL